MKKKEFEKGEDDLLESDLFDREDGERPKKLFDRNTIFLVIIFSLTFFILGNATGFFLLDKAGRARQTDPDFYAASSVVRSNPLTNDINGTGKGGQSVESKVETTADASSAEVSEQVSNPSGNADNNAAQKQTGGKNGQTNADNQATENNNAAVHQSENHTDGTRVYVTPSGKKYHLSASCGGDNSYETTLEEALSEGKTPCKKCAQ